MATRTYYNLYYQNPDHYDNPVFNIFYHPDFQFLSRYPLYWNTGNGFTTTNCINAKGNENFSNDGFYRDFDLYIGAGRPDETLSLNIPLYPSSGLMFGFVRGYYLSRPQESNVGSISAYGVFEEYKKSAVATPQKFGVVSIGGLSSNNVVSQIEWVNNSRTFTLTPNNNKDGLAILSEKKVTATPNASYVFLGWYKDGELLSTNKTIDTGTNEGVYEARFSFTYDVVFNANGGSGSMPNQQFKYGVNENLNKNTFVRDGYIFAGWANSPDGDVAYNDSVDGSLITETAGEIITLYAVWKRPNITITNIHPERGKIFLFSTYDNKIVAEQLNDNVLAFQGVAGRVYRVDAEASSDLYAAKGVYVDGNYINPYQFTLGADAIERDFYFKEKTLYNINISSTPNGNIASVTSPAEPDKDGKYVEGRVITITGTPAPGYKLKAASIFDADENLPIGDFDNIENNSFTIDGGITCNLRIACVFVKVDYDVSTSVDEESMDAISGVTAKIGDLNVVTATYGDIVTFEADVTNDYQFGGWYADNVLISADNPYNHTVNGNINLVAKAKVSVNLSIEHINNRDDIEPINSCSLIVDEIEVPIPHSLDVILGESFSYALLLGALTAETSDMWKFDAWYSGETALPYRKDDTITPTGNLSMTAKVTSAPIERTLSISFINEETSGAIAIGEDAVKISPEPKSKIVDGSTATFVFEGTQEVQITFADEIAANESLSFSKVVIGGIEIADGVFTYLLNGDIQATAYYGSEGERTTSIDFTANSDRTMGEIVIDGKTSATEAMPISIVKNRGEEVAITARSKNGYKFVGWYINASGIGDPYIKLVSTSLKVTTNRTLFAKFVQDPNAVYEWEGSNENKMMTWRSKSYEATKPFNPTACRVDTTGYPVWKMSVEMFSAPDAAPTAVATLTNVRSQDSRRLPIRRLERYMQVAMENNNEVDAVFVGTSMGGLAV